MNLQYGDEYERNQKVRENSKGKLFSAFFNVRIKKISAQAVNSVTHSLRALAMINLRAGHYL